MSGESKPTKRPCPKCGSIKWTYLMGKMDTQAIGGCSDCPRGKPDVTLDFVKGKVRYGE